MVYIKEVKSLISLLITMEALLMPIQSLELSVTTQTNIMKILESLNDYDNHNYELSVIDGISIL